MQTKSKIEKPTRKAKARAMRRDLLGPPLPPRNMKNRAVAKLAMTAKKPKATK
jgi:hypothetical protein